MPPVSSLCASRLHDWGPGGGKPGAACIRPGCAKVFGVRLNSKAASVDKPNGESRSRSAGGSYSSDALRRAAARISGRPLADASPTQEEPATPPAEEKLNLVELLKPFGPDLIVNSSATLINRGVWFVKPRQALEPAPERLAMFKREWEKSVTRLLPRVELPWYLALALTAGAVMGSMWWGAPLLNPPEPEPKPEPQSASKPQSEETPCPAEPSAAGGAATPGSVPTASDQSMPVSLPPLSHEAMNANLGSADDAEPDA